MTQFNIRLDQRLDDLATFERRLQAQDPAALADTDASDILRVSTSLGEDEIAASLRMAGHTGETVQIERQASTCCGGCGG
ncbi:hypothetical protein FZO89_07360 [Luteimonas viscosa]|uniref:Uncharacterized protein n=1 Tax=Luteimonas viscosa TaxID=1132694 RepID=A0A5D4XTJ0_9GAMM|nr:hypothetical protein [Luteimonas viscosa]TYT26090.1 hypothetical protein FZO89_07360 [Luteimonas viscosa]